MMGQQSGAQDRLFYSFNLDAHVPADHLLRGIDRFLDLSDLRQHLTAFYSHTGRPSIDPELMVRMLLVGYCFGIRSERRLCEEVHLNLAYRWFCRLGLEDGVPDHSTFSKNRHGRFRDCDAFRQLFETVVERCITEGLVGGEGFAIDASIIRADANRRRGTPSTAQVEWPAPEQRTRAVREYLEALDASEPVGAPPKYLSMTDPAARWTAAPGCPAFYAYSTNYLVDVKSGVIVDVEATAAHRTEETEATKTMIDRVAERHEITPQRLIGDTAYGTGPMLEWLVEDKGIEPHVPVWDKSKRSDDTFSVSEFQWNEQANEYRCPGGEALRNEWRKFKNPRSRVTQDSTVIYHADPRICAQCPLKPRCCPNMPTRKIARSLYEKSRAFARQVAETAAYRQSRKDRKKVEVLFAHLKRILKLDRLRLRGRRGARDEFLLAATAQNLRRMARKWMQTTMTEPIAAT
jgi:transposase